MACALLLGLLGAMLTPTPANAASTDVVVRLGGPGRWQPAAGGLLGNGQAMVAGGRDYANNLITTTQVFDPRTRTWSTTGAMSTIRIEATSQILQSGKAISIGGANATGTTLATAEIYDPATGTWSATASMTTARRAAASTVLSDGRVLAAGGYNNTTTPTSAEIYDPATGQWTTAASMNRTRTRFSLVTLADGRALAAGGNGTTAEIYDPATNTWTLTSPMPTAGSNSTATLLGNGKVLIAGGLPTLTQLLYDPSTDTWTTTGITNQHTYPTATLLADGRVLLADTTVDIYDPVSNTWTPGAPININNSQSLATRLPDGTVLLTANYSGTVIYAPTGTPVADIALSGSLTPAGPLTAGTPSTYQLVIANNGSAPARDVLVLRGAIPEGLVINEVSGSCTGFPCELGDLATGTQTTITITITADPALSQVTTFYLPFEAYPRNFETNRADNTLTPYLPVQRATASTDVVVRLGGPGRWQPAAGGLLGNGQAMVAGGRDYANNLITTTQVFDPRTRTWSTTGAMSTIRIEATSQILQSGKAISIGGANATGTTLATAEIYDPATGTWSATASMTTARRAAASTVLSDGRVLAAGGYNNTTTPTSAEIYDPATGQWTTAASMNRTRTRFSLVTLADGRALAAGGNGTTAEIYDPATNTWTLTSPMPTAGSNSTATLLGNGKVLIAGGLPTLTQLLYDPSTDTWTTTGITNQHTYPTATLLADGRVLLADTTVDIYDPVSNTWTPGAPININNSQSLATRLPDGTVLLTANYSGTVIYAPTSVVPPSAPTGVRVTVASHSATITWLKPASSGGATIIGYTVIATPGGQSCSTDSADILTCTITGLTNGTAYTFEVQARNRAGSSPPATPPPSDGGSTGIVVGTPPDPVKVEDPVIVIVPDPGGGPGTTEVTLRWLAAASDPALPVIGYRATAEPGGASCSTDGALFCTIVGLDPAVHYSFTIVAINGVGSSPVTVPGRPTQVLANSAGGSRVTVAWTAPETTGGTPILTYRVVADPGGSACLVSAPTRSCTFTGLTPGSTYTFTVQATNAQGDSSPSEPSAPFTVPTDVHPPVVTSSLPSGSVEGWYREPVVITWQVTDPDTPIANVTVPQSTTAWVEGRDVTYTSGQACDPAGNCATGTAKVSLDRTGPTVAVSANQPLVNGWYAAPVALTATCDDALSGVLACHDEPVQVTADGATLVEFSVSDRAGNVTTFSRMVFVDSTAPEVQAVLDPAPNAAGWHNSAVTIRWVATDAQSPATTPPSVTINTDGRDQVVASAPSCDAAGNCGTGTVRVSIDTSAPTISGTVINDDGSPRAPDGEGWYRTAVRVRWTCADDMSGVAVCPSDSYLSHDGEDLSVSAVTTDLAGNQATGSLPPIKIDSTAPISSASTPCGSAHACTGTSVVVSLSAEDAGSGVAEIRARIGNSSVDAVVAGSSGTIEVPLDDATGEAVVSYWAVDRAGNAEALHTVHVSFDNVIPSITHVVQPAPNAAGWNNTDVTVHWVATDDSAGSVTVTPDSSYTTETTGTTVIGKATDSAGNEASDSVTIKIDKTPPSIHASISGTQNAAGVYVGAVLVHFDCLDTGGSGLVSCPADQLLTTPGVGITVTGSARDAADNEATDTSRPFTIAAPPPVISLPGGSPHNLQPSESLSGNVTTTGAIVQVLVTYTPQGGGRTPVTVVGTATVVSAVAGVVTYAWSATPPTGLNGRVTAVVSITDSFGQTVSAPPITVNIVG